MNLTLEQKQEIGRQVREENSGSKELQICEMFGLTQVGGSRTKVDGQHPDGTNWSIKNAKSTSTGSQAAILLALALAQLLM